MSDFTKNHKYLNKLNNNISSITDKIQNVDKHLPGELNKQFSTVKKQLRHSEIKNKSVFDRANEQGFIKNLFDKDVRGAKKEVYGLQKQFKNLQKQRDTVKKKTLDGFKAELDSNLADLHNFKSSSRNYKKLNNNIISSQQAYDKAVRDTRRARLATAGTVGVAGAGVYGMNKMQQKKEQNNNLEYINPVTGLNNNI